MNKNKLFSRKRSICLLLVALLVVAGGYAQKITVLDLTRQQGLPLDGDSGP